MKNLFMFKTIIKLYILVIFEENPNTTAIQRNCKKKIFFSIYCISLLNAQNTNEMSIIIKYFYFFYWFKTLYFKVLKDKAANGWQTVIDGL